MSTYSIYIEIYFLFAINTSVIVKLHAYLLAGANIRALKHVNDYPYINNCQSPKLAGEFDMSKNGNGLQPESTKKNIILRPVIFLVKAILWLLRKLIIGILILVAVMLVSMLYTEVAEIKDDKKELFDYYKQTLIELNPATSHISSLKDVLMTDITVAEEDGKISISEFVSIEQQYKQLEALIFKTALEVQNQQNKQSESKESEKEDKENKEDDDKAGEDEH